MKVSLKWLKDYVDIDLSPDDLAHKLTMVGLEVDDIMHTGGSWDNVFVAQVTNIDRHPNADRLSLATLDLGQEQCTVVCGAPNIAVGQRVPFAKVGAHLPDGHTGKLAELKPAKIRGVRSEGMVCSEMELGISGSHEGILILAEDAPVGSPLAEYMGDVVFDVKVTPNRPDCLCMIGIAREVAAITGKELRVPIVEYPELDSSADEMISIEIVDADLCPRYCGGIIKDITIGQSPQWMQERLMAAGMRPINNIVDITNFVLLEYGQPLHAFDYEGIGGKKIIVRRAKEKEGMPTLDGEMRELSNDMLVIADENHPVAIAGVMGGADSEVAEKTTIILLESANFNNVSIRHTSVGLDLVSEASTRFDKGLSPDLPLPAIRRAIQLMVDLAGGKAAKGIVDVYPGFNSEKRSITLTRERATQILGIDFGIPRIIKILESLGFSCENRNGSELTATIPYWRTDIKIAEDLIEEVARTIGYEEIPTTMLCGEIPQHDPTPLAELKQQLSDTLVGCGMQEIINYSLTSWALLEKTGYHERFGSPLQLANPMSQQQEYLRTSLRGGLLTTFAANQRLREKGLMLFEIGKVYLPREDDLPQENDMLTGLAGGTLSDRSWSGNGDSFDFYRTKGILETMFAHLGIKANFEQSEDHLLVNGQTACISVEGQEVGVLGVIHPNICADFDIIIDPLCLFEIEVGKLVPLIQRLRTFKSIPRFPGIDRDLALLAEIDLPAKRIEDIIQGFPHVSRISLFDVYQGEQVSPGKKSLAFSVRYQSHERTLTDKEVDKIQEKILARLDKNLGVVLRQ